MDPEFWNDFAEFMKNRTAKQPETTENTDNGEQNDNQNVVSQPKSDETVSPVQKDKDETEQKPEEDFQAKISALETSVKQKDERILELTNQLTELNKVLSSGNKKEAQKKKSTMYQYIHK